MKTSRIKTAHLRVLAAAGALTLGLSSCTATPGPLEVSSPPAMDPARPSEQPTPSWPSPVPAPQTQGEALASFASAATPGGSSLSTGAFEANGSGLDFNIGCQGTGTITVNVTDVSGDAGPGIASFNTECEAGKLTSMGNRDHTPHGVTSVQVLAPDGVGWAMTVGAVPAGETPPA